jgi:hypothetical protein
MDTGAGVMTDLLDMSQIAAAKMNAQDTSASRWRQQSGHKFIMKSSARAKDIAGA